MLLKVVNSLAVKIKDRVSETVTKVCLHHRSWERRSVEVLYLYGITSQETKAVVNVFGHTIKGICVWWKTEVHRRVYGCWCV